MSDVMHIINTSLIYVSSWFVSVFESTGTVGIYLSFLFIVLTVRFLIQPFVGAATFTAASDRVRRMNENSRYKGSFERNNKGRFSK